MQFKAGILPISLRDVRATAPAEIKGGSEANSVILLSNPPYSSVWLSVLTKLNPSEQGFCAISLACCQPPWVFCPSKAADFRSRFLHHDFPLIVFAHLSSSTALNYEDAGAAFSSRKLSSRLEGLGGSPCLLFA